jgi:hypothetical protein
MQTKDCAVAAVAAVLTPLTEEEARLVQAVGVVDLRPEAVADLGEVAAVQIPRLVVTVGSAVVVAARLARVEN